MKKELSKLDDYVDYWNAEDGKAPDYEPVIGILT
jgi:hypothetical protein